MQTFAGLISIDEQKTCPSYREATSQPYKMHLVPMLFRHRNPAPRQAYRVTIDGRARAEGDGRTQFAIASITPSCVTLVAATVGQPSRRDGDVPRSLGNSKICILPSTSYKRGYTGGNTAVLLQRWPVLDRLFIVATARIAKRGIREGPWRRPPKFPPRTDGVSYYHLGERCLVLAN